MPSQTTNQLDDAALLAAYAKGMPEAARILTERLTPKLYAQAYHRLQNAADAEDIAQEAMLRLWKIAPDWQSGRAKLSTWLYQVVANLCKDRCRKPQMTGLEQAPEPIDPSLAVESHLQDERRASALYKALYQVPQRQAQALRMRHLDELSNPEIAAILAVSIKAVESLLARGRRQLKTCLEAEISALGYHDEKV